MQQEGGEITPAQETQHLIEMEKQENCCWNGMLEWQAHAVDGRQEAKPLFPLALSHVSIVALFLTKLHSQRRQNRLFHGPWIVCLSDFIIIGQKVWGEAGFRNSVSMPDHQGKQCLELEGRLR